MVAGKVVPVLLSWLGKSVDHGVPLTSQAYLVAMLDLRPIFCEEGHVACALDAGGALRSDRVAERAEIKIWIIEKVMVRQGEAVDIQLVGSVRIFVWPKSLVNFNTSSEVRREALGE